jgi:hypothetical protein
VAGIKFSLVPEITARILDEEIERTRREIADLQKRVRDMAIRRQAKEGKSEGKTQYPQISRIDSEIDDARQVIRNHPEKASILMAKIAALETEQYRLLLSLDEER